jgi:hypothetical protein
MDISDRQRLINLETWKEVEAFITQPSTFQTLNITYSTLNEAISKAAIIFYDWNGAADFFKGAFDTLCKYPHEPSFTQFVREHRKCRWELYLPEFYLDMVPNPTIRTMVLHTTSEIVLPGGQPSKIEESPLIYSVLSSQYTNTEKYQELIESLSENPLFAHIIFSHYVQQYTTKSLDPHVCHIITICLIVLGEDADPILTSDLLTSALERGDRVTVEQLRISNSIHLTENHMRLSYEKGIDIYT